MGDFTQKETTKYHDDLDNKAVQKLKNASAEEVEELVKKWTNAFKEVIYIAINFT